MVLPQRRQGGKSHREETWKEQVLQKPREESCKVNGIGCSKYCREAEQFAKALYKLHNEYMCISWWILSVLSLLAHPLAILLGTLLASSPGSFLFLLQILAQGKLS